MSSMQTMSPVALEDTAAKAVEHSEKKRKKISVSPDEPPSRRLVLKIVKLQSHSNKLTDRITSGLSVTAAEWVAVRNLTNRLGDTFSSEVQIAWEESDEADAMLEGNNHTSSPNV